MTNIVEYILSLKGNQFDTGIASATSGVRGLESALGSVGTMIGVTFGLAAVSAFASKMLEAGSAVENAQTGLTTLLKNSQEAKQVIANTMEDATKTPFAFEGLLMANKALIAADESAKGAREMVLNLSNAIAATGGGDEELQRMVINLQQIKNTGQATSLDLKQFAYAGVNLYKVLDEAGIKHGENQKVTYEQIAIALKKAHEEGGIYYNGLENMAGNTSVQISNLGDAVFQLSVQMFNDLKPAIMSAISALSSVVTWFKEAWQWSVENQGTIKALAAGFTAFAGVAYVVIPALEGVALAIAAVSTSAGAAAVVGGPITLLALAIGTLTYAYYELSTAAEQAQRAVNYTQQSYVDETKKSLDEQVALYVNYGNKQEEAERKVYEGRKKLAQEESMNAASEYERVKKNKEQGAGYAGIDAELEKLGAEVIRTDANLRAVDDWRKNKTSAATTSAIGKAGAKPAKVDTKADKAVGHKSVTINVSINDIVKTFNVNVTNVKEGAAKAREVILQGLMGAINDAQITAGS